MRLINVKTRKLENFNDNEPVDYAILSHRWTAKEIQFNDVSKRWRKWPRKLTGCCERAKQDGLKYIWCDTCCIKKSDSVELNEAITSMYKWYKRSKVCYAFLEDVPADDDPNEQDSMFRASSWFTRGWTLQELLAPQKLEFFNANWDKIGCKASLRDVVTDITRIPPAVLLDPDILCYASVAQRMSWAANRITTKDEDIAYCLIGLFNVSMLPLYGEGNRAFTRLQEAIMKEHDDHSLFTWSLQAPSGPEPLPSGGPCPFLAKSPADFSESDKVITHAFFSTATSPSFKGGRIVLDLPIFTERQSNQMYCLLNCTIEGMEGNILAVPLESASSDEILCRPRHVNCLLVHRPSMRQELVCQSLQIELEWQKHAQIHQSFCYVDTSRAPSLMLIGVYPEFNWIGNCLISIPGISFQGSVFLRFQLNFENDEIFRHRNQDFIVIVPQTNDSTVRTCMLSPDFSLAALNDHMPNILSSLKHDEDIKAAWLPLEVSFGDPVKVGGHTRLVLEIEFRGSSAVHEFPKSRNYLGGFFSSQSSETFILTRVNDISDCLHELVSGQAPRAGTATGSPQSSNDDYSYSYTSYSQSPIERGRSSSI